MRSDFRVDKHALTAASLALSACSAMLVATAVQAKDHPSTETEGTKNSNIAAAKQLNGDSDDLRKQRKSEDIAENPKAAAKEAKAQAASTGEKTDGKGKEQLGGNSTLSDEKNKESAKKTANVVNQVPGVKVTQKDLEPPTAAPIKGFHPIKKLLRPVENLEKEWRSNWNSR